VVDLLLKVSGRIVEGDGDPVIPNEPFDGGDALATDDGSAEEASVRLGRNVQAELELAALGEFQMRQQQQTRAARIAGNCAADLVTVELDLRHEVYGFAWNEPFVFGFRHPFHCSSVQSRFQPAFQRRK